jgi:UDP-N-acetylmuramate dehydrogenase
MEWKGIRGTVLRNVPISKYTSMKVGGPVKNVVYPCDHADLLKVIEITRGQGMKYRFLGNGTNIIVSDQGLDETLIRITRIRHLRYEKTVRGALVEVSGGLSLKQFIKQNAERGFSGLEKLYWIPGTVGGGIKMNAGSFGSSVSDVLEAMHVVCEDGIMRSLTRKEMTFGYRTSPVKRGHCVATALFRMEAREKAAILHDMDQVYEERKKRHPMEFPSAGSVFKKVDHTPAWELIEKSGLKGLTVGGAAVSEKHANFIVNTGSATARDVKNLVDRIKRAVFETTGVALEEEVEFWGFDA